MGTFEQRMDNFELNRKVDHEILKAIMKELNLQDYEIIGNTQDFKVRLSKEKLTHTYTVEK